MEQEEKITSPVEAGTDSTPVEAAPEAAPAKGHHHEGGRKGQGGRRTERRAPAEKLYEERVVKIRRVCKTTKGGRHMRFSALVVVGDVKGKYGFGVGKSVKFPKLSRKLLMMLSYICIDSQSSKMVQYLIQLLVLMVLPQFSLNQPLMVPELLPVVQSVLFWN